MNTRGIDHQQQHFITTTTTTTFKHELSTIKQQQYHTSPILSKTQSTNIYTS